MNKLIITLLTLLFAICEITNAQINISPCGPPPPCPPPLCSASTNLCISGGTEPYTFLWSPGGQTTQNISGLCLGQYTLAVTDASSATATATVTISSSSYIVSCTANPDTIVPGDSTTLNSFPSGGTPPYFYFWNPSTALSCQGCQTTLAVPTTSICYTITVTDANGCTATCQACVVVDSTLGINEHDINTKFKVYPNPTTGEITIATDEKGIFTASISNAQGKEVVRKSFEKEIKLSLPHGSAVTKGIYTVKVCTTEGNMCHTEKVVLQ